MNVEHIWYECSPYLYAGFATTSAITVPQESAMRAPAILLIGAALAVIAVRCLHRFARARLQAALIDDKKYVMLVTQDLFFDAMQPLYKRHDQNEPY